MQTQSLTQVVIVGGGFGGLSAAKELVGQDVGVKLIDKTNHHLFQPLLYQVATGGVTGRHRATHPSHSQECQEYRSSDG
jgi:NADH dehydrogenase